MDQCTATLLYSSNLRIMIRSGLTELDDVMVDSVIQHFHASDSTGYTIQVDLSHPSTSQSGSIKSNVERSTETQDHKSRGAQDRGEMAQDGEDQLERPGWERGSSVVYTSGPKLMNREYGSVLIDQQGLKLVLIVYSPVLHVRWADE
jgi:hypothetical protein